jgi:serine/threonine protein kinase
VSTADLLGQTLGGRYQIQSMIGQGGMASVYKAYDQNLHRAVAIKVIHPHLSNNREFFRRFEEEATAIANLRHPNIIQVYDFSHEGDLYYMVMEFVMGETLQTRLERLNLAGQRLSFADVITYVTDICEAAYSAHQRGMIHRDIKPSNIMLDTNGRAILMDFGIARIVGASHHTATGAVLGSAMYMSPEQIQGLQIDSRTDIYSIGVTLFEMLSGKPPFEADSAMTLMMMHVHDPVPDLHQLKSDIPIELIKITNKALMKNRDERYQSTNEIVSALRELPDHPIKTQVMVSKPSPPLSDSNESAFIETGEMKDIGETIIESVGQAVPVKEKIKAELPQTESISAQAQPTLTLQEQVVMPVGPKTVSAGAPVPERMPTGHKKIQIWVPIFLMLLIAILGGGGYFSYTKFFMNGAIPTSFQSQIVEVGDLFTEAATLEGTYQLIPTLLPTITQSQVPNSTQAQLPFPTLQPILTETTIPSLRSKKVHTTTPTPVVIGGADKIAFILGRNIWEANLDGSELTQLTNNKMEKTYLRWLPGGQALSYITGKCVESVTLSGEVSKIACFDNVVSLDCFEVSPDGKQVAISLDSQIYLVPFDIEKLSQADSPLSLSSMATCANMAPYTRNSVRFVRWSDDSKTWAVVSQTPYNDILFDIVAVFPIDICYSDSYAAYEIQFPPPHFTFPSYDQDPSIQDLAFDGNSIFVFHGISSNNGFGDLHSFKMDTFKFSAKINPINNTCCYRDVQFSPDGSYLVFAYQDISLGSESVTRLYYIPFGSIGTGETYEPLPLPEIINLNGWPQPALRPASP